MKFNGFIVAIVVLAALGAALYWSNHHMPSETTQASAETPPKILTLNEADINKIDIKKKGGEEVTLTKDNGGNWKVIAPKPLGADHSADSSMLSSLSSLNSDRKSTRLNSSHGYISYAVFCLKKKKKRN